MKITLQSTRFNDCVYYKFGNGFPILLVHGFGEDSGIWKYQIEELQHHYTLIVPDFPGSGSSVLPQEEMSMDLLAHFMMEILQQEKIDKVLLVGHSMGGYASLKFLEKYPEFLVGLSLVHSSAYEDDDAKKENRQKSIKLIQNDGKELFLKTMIPNLYSEESKKYKQLEMDQHLTMAMEVSSKALQAYYTAMIHRSSSISTLQNTNIPVQFVIGTDDNAVSFAQSLKQCSIPSIAKVDIFDKIGHSSMFETPQQLNESLERFFQYAIQQ